MNIKEWGVKPKKGWSLNPAEVLHRPGCTSNPSPRWGEGSWDLGVDGLPGAAPPGAHSPLSERRYGSPVACAGHIPTCLFRTRQALRLLPTLAGRARQRPRAIPGSQLCCVSPHCPYQSKEILKRQPSWLPRRTPLHQTLHWRRGGTVSSQNPFPECHLNQKVQNWKRPLFLSFFF